jgi:hypothetical protein
MCGGSIFVSAKPQTQERTETCQANPEVENQDIARKNCLIKMKTAYSRETGEYLQAERRSINGEYYEDIVATTAGNIKIEKVSEDWSKWGEGKVTLTYKLTIDPDDMKERLAKIQQNKQMAQELEDERRKREAAEAEKERLRQEAEEQSKELELYKRQAEMYKRQSQQTQQGSGSSPATRLRMQREANEAEQRYEESKRKYETTKKEYQTAANNDYKTNYSSTKVGTDVAKVGVGMWYQWSPSAPFGLYLGGCENRWGFYIGFRLGFATPFDSIISDAHKLRHTPDLSKKTYYRGAITVGTMLRLWDWCFLYGGLGYGEYGSAYKITKEIYYVPNRYRGLEVEGGVMFVYNRWLSLSAGYNMLLSGQSQRLSNYHIGVGFFLY